MIAFLRGKLAEALPTQVAVDVNGVGYELFVPLSTFDRLGEVGKEVTACPPLKKPALTGFLILFVSPRFSDPEPKPSLL